MGKEFRELYCSCDTHVDGCMTFEALCGLFERIVTLDTESRQELRAFYDAQLSSNDAEGLEFWDFIMLMRRVEDLNWRHIYGDAVYADRDRRRRKTQVEEGNNFSIF